MSEVWRRAWWDKALFVLELNSVWNSGCHHHLCHLACSLKRGAVLCAYTAFHCRDSCLHTFWWKHVVCVCVQWKERISLECSKMRVMLTSDVNAVVYSAVCRKRIEGKVVRILAGILLEHGTSVECRTNWDLLGRLVWKHFRVDCSAVYSAMHHVYFWEIPPSKPGQPVQLQFLPAFGNLCFAACL